MGYISSTKMKVCTWSEWWDDNDTENDYGCDDEEASTTGIHEDSAAVKAHRMRDHSECLDTTTTASTESKGQQLPSSCVLLDTARRVLHNRRRTRLVLDIRSQEDFDERHLVSTPWTLPTTTDNASDDDCDELAALRDDRYRLVVVVHIPYCELTHRRFELPPRHVPFAILFNPQLDDWMTTRSNGDDTGATDSFLPQIVLGLLAGDYSSTVEINSSSSHDNVNDHSVHARPNRLSCPWNVTALLLASDEMWQQAHQSGVSLRQSDLHDTENEQQRVLLFQPDPRLWSPDSMVEHVLLPLLTTDFSVSHHRGAAVDKVRENQRERPVAIWDLGAGVGRDVCFLAEELRAHFCRRDVSQQHEPFQQFPFLVVGLDQRYRDVDKNEAIDFWKRRRVESVTSCRCVDLNDVEMVERLMAANLDGQQTSSVPDSIETDRTPSFVQCFYAVRYWNQPLFAMLVRSGLDRRLRSGTIVAIAQFGKPYANAPWPFPHPKEKHVLERDELRALFSTPLSTTPTDHTGASFPCWNIVHDQVVLDSDHGRTLIQFVAQLQY
jgi:hypothetical protein